MAKRTPAFNEAVIASVRQDVLRRSPTLRKAAILETLRDIWLHPVEGVTPSGSYIARALGLSHSAISPVLTALENEGAVVSVGVNANRRWYPRDLYDAAMKTP